MPVVIDINATDDQRDLVHRAVQALAEGKLVAFPTDSGYCVAASAVHEDAVSRLAARGSVDAPAELAIAIKSCDEAFDYAPNLSPLGLRLGRRCWPGPLTLSVDDGCDESLVRRLPASVQQALLPRRHMNLRVPAHPLILAVLRLAPAPLVVSDRSCGGTTGAVCAQDVVQALGDDVQLVLDAGPSKSGQPSTIVRVEKLSYEVIQPGMLSDENLRRLASFMLVFVCTGNTCRSPMAEVLMQRRLAEKLGCTLEELEDRGVWVLSAGVAAMAGGRAAQEANDAVNDWGVRLIHHESQPLSDRIVRFADLVLTMTRSHRDAVLAQWPDAAKRVRLLTRGEGDVADPIGGPIEDYRRCAQQIDSHLGRWLDDLELGEFPFWHES